MNYNKKDKIKIKKKQKLLGNTVKKIKQPNKINHVCLQMKYD